MCAVRTDALSVSEGPGVLDTGCPHAFTSRSGLNGKQVQDLCCPRNGKRAWAYHDATVREVRAWEGGTPSSREPVDRPGSTLEMPRGSGVPRFRHRLPC